MVRDKLYDEATDEVDLKVTPEAAEETADNLVEGAVKARGQRRLKDLPHKAK